jgi:hypothetical protein
MTTLLAALLGAAVDTGAIAVVADSKRPGAGHDADELVSIIYLALVDAGVPRDALLLEDQADRRTNDGRGPGAFARSKQCEGRSICLRTLAQLLGNNGVVVGADVGRAGSEVAAHVLAVAAAGDPLAELDFSADAAMWRAACASQVAAFARTVASRWTRPAAKQATVVPAVPPVERAAPAPVAAPPVESVSSGGLPAALKWPSAVAAAVSFVASAVLLGAGLSAKSSYDRALVDVGGLHGTLLTDADARRLASQANLELSLALTAALLGAAFTAVAAWVFSKG